MLTPGDFYALEKRLLELAERLTSTGPEGLLHDPAPDAAMLDDCRLAAHWWSGAVDWPAEEEARLRAAVLEIARTGELPSAPLPASTRGRLALRLRLASRCFRNLHRGDPPPGLWPTLLAHHSTEAILGFVLEELAPVWTEVLDETLLWASSLGWPTPGEGDGKPPQNPTSSED
jgi:hypothetical protein